MTGAAASDGTGPRTARPGRVLQLAAYLAATTLLAACEEESPRPAAAVQELSPNASPQVHAALVERRRAPRSPADGGGRAWLQQQELLDGGEGDVQAGTRGRWTLVYEAGELGVAEGGAVVLQVSPFWGWSAPVVDPERRLDERQRDGVLGLTTVHTDAAGVELSPRTFGERGDTSQLVVTIGGRALAAGERLVFTYGAGSAGARADRFAERASVFWFLVDGDGDGVPGVLLDSPRVAVAPGPPAQLSALASTSLRPGEQGRLVLAVLDARGNAGLPVEGELVLVEPPPELELPERIALRPEHAGRITVPFTAGAEEGVFRFGVHLAGTELVALSNPVVVHAQAQPVRWADLHGHSGLSDGTGTPDEYFRYARDVAGLDVVALTDHDHWGMAPLDMHPELWEEITQQAAAFHQPGRFVTLHGYEWTSWLHGHRHVLSFGAGPDLPLLSAVDERYQTPQQLWEALAGLPVLTVAHHSAGAPVATNWSFRPDPRVEPVTEVVSVHGSSEADDAPFPVRAPVAGNFVRDVLDRGLRFGFVGSGDSHDGHPGLAHLSNPTGSGGLAAILADELSREGVLAALRARRCYATSGPRIVLRASLAGARQGAALPVPDGEASLVVVVHGTAPLAVLEVVRDGTVVERREPPRAEGEGPVFDDVAAFALRDLSPGSYVYVRVVQVDGHAAWTSPFFLE